MPITPEQLAQYDHSIIATVKKYFGSNTEVLTHNTAPGLWNAANELATRAGVRARIFIVDSVCPKYPNTIAAHLPNAAGGPMLLPGDGNVFLTRGFMERGHVSPHSTPEPWVKGVLAHEMGHIKQGFSNLFFARQWPLIAPLAAVTGLWLYEQFAHKEGDEKIKSLSKPEHEKAFETFADDAIAQQEKTEEKARAGDIDAQVASHSAANAASMRMGKYLAATALGLGVGLAATRLHMRQLEFDADKFAVQVTRDPQAVIDVFPNIQRMFKEAFAELPKNLKTPTWTDRFRNEFTHFHPTNKERIANIRRIAKEMGLGSGTHTNAHIPLPQASFADTLQSERLLEQALSATTMPNL